MTIDAAFFLAPDDEGAASAHRGGPLGRYPAVTGRDFYGDDAVDLWDAHFVGSPPGPGGRQRTDWIVPVTNDGSGTLAFPPRLTRALAGATAEELGELADRWGEKLRREDSDEMTDDDLLAIVTEVARLAASAVTTGGRLYCWFY